MHLAALIVLAAAAEGSHSLSPFVEIISVVAAIVGSAIGGIATWYGVRRKTSGRIGTSDADILWQQSSEMRTALQAQLDKAIEQRDRLIDSQASNILPMISGITESLKELGTAVGGFNIFHEEEKRQLEEIRLTIAEDHEILTGIRERLGRSEILQIQGTATRAGPNSASGKGEGHGDHAAGGPGG